VLISLPASAGEASSSSPQKYLESLIERGKEKRLAHKRTWQLLLHYRTDRFGPGVTSEIDGDEFFLATTGKIDPEAELTATLVAFFSNQKIGVEKRLPQCAFPARELFLPAAFRVGNR
jgi:hypothetical protein